MIRVVRVLTQNREPVKRKDYQIEQVARYRELVEVCPIKDSETEFIYPYTGILRIREGEHAVLELNEDEERYLEKDATLSGKYRLQEIKREDLREY